MPSIPGKGGKPMNTNASPIARLSSVVKRYGNHTAVNGLDLMLHRGEIFALLGPNGAGKSTTISMLLGLVRPDAGRVELFGEDPQQLGGAASPPPRPAKRGGARPRPA